MNQTYVIAAAVIISGGLIASSLILSGGPSPTATGGHGGDGFGNNLSPTAENVREVTNDDHIRGDATAQISIVEYSDYECPFCARLHPTLTRVIEERGDEVNWVYRHFPLSNIHHRALGASVAAECVAQLGGNDAFWTFSDELFAKQRALGEDLYKELATDLGIGAARFDECLDDNNHAERIAADRQNAIDAGGRGTPFVVVVNGSGQVFPFSGALPYENIMQIINAAITSS